MSDKKPGLILTISAMAQMLMENLDRADCESFAHAAAIIDAAAQAPGVPAHKVEQWQKAVALYNAALLEFPPPGAIPEIPADWLNHQPPAEVYEDSTANAEAFAIWAEIYPEDANPDHDDTQRKPRVTFEP